MSAELPDLYRRIYESLREVYEMSGDMADVASERAMRAVLTMQAEREDCYGGDGARTE
jgi:hypothetical protein